MNRRTELAVLAIPLVLAGWVSVAPSPMERARDTLARQMGVMKTIGGGYPREAQVGTVSVDIDRLHALSVKSQTRMPRGMTSCVDCEDR